MWGDNAGGDERGTRDALIPERKIRQPPLPAESLNLAILSSRLGNKVEFANFAETTLVRTHRASLNAVPPRDSASRLRGFTRLSSQSTARLVSAAVCLRHQIRLKFRE